jgi:hypothetical protein
MGETGNTAVERQGMSMGEFSNTLREEEPEGTVMDSTVDRSMDSSMLPMTDDASSIPRPTNILELLHSRGRISSRGSGNGAFENGESGEQASVSRAWEGGSAGTAAASSMAEGTDGHALFTDSMAFHGSMGSVGRADSMGGGSTTGRSGSGRPPLAPSLSASGYGSDKPPVRMIEVPRKGGKPPLLLLVPFVDRSLVGSAGGFRNQLPHNPEPYHDVSPPRRTPSDFMRGSRFRDSTYSRPEDRLIAAKVAAQSILSQRPGKNSRYGWPVPEQLVSGLEGKGLAGKTWSNFRAKPRPLGDVVGRASDYLLTGVLSSYVGGEIKGVPDAALKPVFTSPKNKESNARF